MDVDYAFLNALLEDDVEIWYYPLSSMNIQREMYIKLKKTFYGLKQAARRWNIDISTYVISIGFTRLVTDSCMYVRGSYAISTLIIIVLYVDYMDIAA